MPHSESRKTSGCDAVVFRKRPLDAVCLTVWNGTHATLEKQEADSGEVSSQHSVGFFKDGYVPPQPNSPPDNVFRPDRPAERALGPKRGAVPRFRFTE
ncbi:hypothetical protein CQW23_34755 [Capsicum baccatum]|uniref:Uncharacterized protein n=1 Tax=Capsicum baccatum TaxID=33114 RepID=A0A2G2UXY9_CAPBA|nr:hypothetical protein CQW23_34755 [Capsicum baccatum]